MKFNKKLKTITYGSGKFGFKMKWPSGETLIFLNKTKEERDSAYKEQYRIQTTGPNKHIKVIFTKFEK